MHLKVFLKLKKNSKNALFWANICKKTKKTHWAGLKKNGFFQACLAGVQVSGILHHAQPSLRLSLIQAHI
jgi:hypothetical protein